MPKLLCVLCGWVNSIYVHCYGKRLNEGLRKSASRR